MAFSIIGYTRNCIVVFSSSFSWEWGLYNDRLYETQDMKRTYVTLVMCTHTYTFIKAGLVKTALKTND